MLQGARDKQMAYLNFKKAFETISYIDFMWKLKKCGLDKQIASRAEI